MLFFYPATFSASPFFSSIFVCELSRYFDKMLGGLYRTFLQGLFKIKKSKFEFHIFFNLAKILSYYIFYKLCFLFRPFFSIFERICMTLAFLYLWPFPRYTIYKWCICRFVVCVVGVIGSWQISKRHSQHFKIGRTIFIDPPQQRCFRIVVPHCRDIIVVCCLADK